MRASRVAGMIAVSTATASMDPSRSRAAATACATRATPSASSASASGRIKDEAPRSARAAWSDAQARADGATARTLLSKDAWAAAHRAAINVRPAPFGKASALPTRPARSAFACCASRPAAQASTVDGGTALAVGSPASHRAASSQQRSSGEGSSISKRRRTATAPSSFSRRSGFTKGGLVASSTSPSRFINIMAAGGVSSSSSLS